LIICHFCHNWGTFILLTWMPTYYNQVFLLPFYFLWGPRFLASTSIYMPYI
jgi:hypothetical protein